MCTPAVVKYVLLEVGEEPDVTMKHRTGVCSFWSRNSTLQGPDPHSSRKHLNSCMYFILFLRRHPSNCKGSLPFWVLLSFCLCEHWVSLDEFQIEWFEVMTCLFREPLLVGFMLHCTWTFLAFETVTVSETFLLWIFLFCAVNVWQYHKNDIPVIVFPSSLIKTPNVVMLAYNPNTWKTDAGRSQVQGQPGLYRKAVGETNKKVH